MTSNRSIYKDQNLSLLLPTITFNLALTSLYLNSLELNCFFSFILGTSRGSLNVARVLHGLGHSSIGALTDASMSFLSSSNILEHRSIRLILYACSPYTPSFLLEQNSNNLWLDAGDTTPWKVRLKSLGGPFFNFVTAFIAIWICWAINFNIAHTRILTLLDLAYGYTAACIGLSSFYILGTSWSDYLSAYSGIASQLYCGNFGFVATQRQSSQKLLASEFLPLYRTMGHETEVRGEQAGGALVMGRDPSNQVVFIGHKVVKSKRGNLTQLLESEFNKVLTKASKENITPPDSNIIGAWHYRFATSSAPSLLETHWHEWTPSSFKPLWIRDGDHWQQRRTIINHRITHNGDFDSWKIFGEEVDAATLGLWLERVLHVSNKTIGDSPKIAGLMDLLVTQGQWFASVRWAYQCTLTNSLLDAFGGELPSKSASNTAPSQQALFQSASLLESTFETFTVWQSRSTETLIQQMVREIIPLLCQDHHLQSFLPQQLRQFCVVAIRGFLENGVLHATQEFLSRAKGSFGLVVLSTLTPDSVIVSAWGQPIAIGFNPRQQYSVYASEPAAVDAVLTGKSQNYRFSLNQHAGEIAVLDANHASVYNLRENRRIPDQVLQKRYFQYPNNPVSTAKKEIKIDPIERDLKDIPKVLHAIQSSWADPQSLNRQTAEHLLNFLVAKTQSLARLRVNLQDYNFDPDLRHSKHVDLLILGVENSLWVGERFANDLQLAFPKLTIHAMSSNQFLQNFQYNFEGLQLSSESIVLAITQSGQTFPTCQAL